MIKNNKLLCLFNLIFAVSLAACGGGGEGASSSSRQDRPGDDVPAEPFRVTSQAAVGGEVSPSSQSVAPNEAAQFQVEADAGYRIGSVSGCGGELKGSTYTTAGITRDCVITANFEPLQSFPVTGRVAGLEGSLLLELQVGESSEELNITGDAGETQTFSFEAEADVGEAFQVSIASEPEHQECQLHNAFGEMPAGGAEPVEASCTSVATTAALSGWITPAANIDVDSDINDRRAPWEENSAPSLAQFINSRAIVHGFASAEPTGGDTQLERFATTEDTDDFYRVSLEAGQLIQLQVVDYPGLDVESQYQGDLDLFLYSVTGEYIASADSAAEFDQVLAPATGDYLVRITAYQGISKYVLRISGVTDAAPADIGQNADFVPDQIIVKWQENADPVSARSAMNTSQMRFAHRDPGRATLVQLERPAPGPSALDTLALSDPLALKSQGKKAPGAAQLSQKGNNNARPSSKPGKVPGLARLNPTGHAKTETLKQIKTLRLRPDVVYAEPNFIRTAFREPNDPGYRYQWHYRAIGLPQAWDREVNASGYEPIVAVIDSGVFLQHPDLAPQLVDGYDFISNPDTSGDGDGLDANPDDPGDNNERGQSSWHGTHVAGTVAAASNNGRGAAGVSRNTWIMPIRVLGEGDASSYDVVQGLLYAAGLPNDSGLLPARPADIANISLGGESGSIYEQEAYREAREAGLIIVAAAGNESRAEPSYPASYGSVISVSATDFIGQLAPYSNYGTSITLAAPGGYMGADADSDGYPDGVLSTLVDDTSGSRQPTYSFYHGTSMAAPHVAGVIALMMRMHPALTPDDVDSLLENGALTDDVGAAGRDNQYGHGIINAAKAISAAETLARGNAPPEAPARVTASPETLYLGFGSRAEVTVANQGGADPQVIATETDAEWLSVFTDNTDSAGLGSYSIVVDRSGLDEGTYRGTVTFAVDDGGLVTTQVYIQVGSASTAANLTQLYVLLIDAETDAVVDTVAAERESGDDTGGVGYQFSDVPLGRYRIMAGSDIDVDGLVCQPGESCGAYPTLERQQPVQVDGNDQTDLDFVANIQGGFPETAGGVDSIEPLRYSQNVKGQSNGHGSAGTPDAPAKRPQAVPPRAPSGAAWPGSMPHPLPQQRPKLVIKLDD